MSFGTVYLAAEVVPTEAHPLTYMNFNATFRTCLPPRAPRRFLGCGFFLGFALLLPRRIGLAYCTLRMDTAR